MFVLLETILKLFYNGGLIVKLIYLFVAISLAIAIFISVVIFLEYGTISFDLNLFYFIIDKYRKFVYILMIIVIIILYLVIYYLNYRLNTRSNCSIRTIDLEEIAPTWLKLEDVRDNIRKELEKELEEKNKNNKDLLFVNDNKLINILAENRTLDLVNKYVKDNRDFINDEEFKIIIELLQLLEKYKEVPSVVSLIDKKHEEKESETKYRNDIVTTDGQNSYTVLSKVNLYNHTLNVVEKAIGILKEQNKEDYVILLSKTIISALAHDIGKIQKLEERFKSIEPTIYKKHPHHIISKLLFLEMFRDYQDKNIIAEAIVNHHMPKLKNSSNLTKILVQADKRAREFEIDQYVKMNAENKNISVEKLNYEIDLNPIDEEILIEKLETVEEEIKEVTLEDKVEEVKVKKVEESKEEQINEEIEQTNKKYPSDMKNILNKHKKNEKVKNILEQKDDYNLFNYKKDEVENEDFEIKDYIDEIIKKMNENILARDKNNPMFGFKVLSITYKNVVLYSLEILENIVSEVIPELSKEQKKLFIKQLILYFYNKKMTAFINPSNEFITSKFVFFKDNNYEIVDTVPIKGDIFDLDANQLYTIKNSDKLFTKIEVLTFAEYKKREK